ncbi:MAG TPA: ABC transporter substrate-binding protein [Candidatus Saccharimonadales bacterium]|nr:ABC transporter substrate-binding protein [Candidatus Saccharimonadales bacterium]
MTRSVPRSAVVAALVISLATAACGGAVQGGASSGPGASDAAGTSGSGVPAPLTYDGPIRFGVFPNITHAPGLIALADGGPLSVLLPSAAIEAVPFNSGTTAVEAMFSEAIDITYIGPNPAINAFAQSNGAAVRIISGSTSGGAFLVVKPGITSAADLKGKTVASPSLGNTQDVALRAWLKSNGLATDKAGGGDVSIVPQENSQTLETFQAGTIDGAWVPEPWATRLITEGGATVLVDERDLWPEGRYVTTHLMVATAFLEAHPDVVERILLANIQAVDRIVEDPAAAQAAVNAQIEAMTTKPIGEELLQTAWNNLTFTVDPVASSLQKSATDAIDLGLLTDPGDLAGLYDLTLLNGVLRSLGRPEVAGL